MNTAEKQIDEKEKPPEDLVDLQEQAVEPARPAKSKTGPGPTKKQSPGKKRAKRNAGDSGLQIKKVLKKVDSKIKPGEPEKQVGKIAKLLKKKEKEEILKGALEKYYNSEELKPYQAELIKMQRHLESTGKKLVILFDGRDASGKGGTIRRITRYMNTKRYRVVALGKPTDEQKTELHIKRYIENFPHAGEIVLFDRSWYNRALVEPVMGFCTQAQYKRFMKKVISYEQNFLEDAGRTILIKLYFSVSKEEQNRRFERRKGDLLRQWKLSEVDLQAQELWDEFTERKFQLLKKTHSKKSPWWIIRSDNKHLARRETMKLILRLVPYKGRNRKLDFTPSPAIVIQGNKELKEMKKQRKKHGRFLA